MKVQPRLWSALCVLSLVLFSRSALVSGQTGFRRLPSDGARLGDLVKTLPKPDGGGQFRPKVIGLDTKDSNFVFAAAGSVQGAGGTYFRSDVTLINHRSVDQRVAVGWMAQGVDNTEEPVQYFTLPALTPIILADFVAHDLHKSGLGSIIVLGQTASGAADPNAVLDGFSRIWSNQPGAQGTVSQGFPSVSIFDSIGSLVAFALGLRHDNRYRTNVGIVNLDTAASHTWTVEVNGLTGSANFEVTVPPLSMRQSGLPSGNYGDLILTLQANGSGFYWSCYGATVDNTSGDSWSSHGSQ